MRRLFLIVFTLVVTFFIGYHVYHLGRAAWIVLNDDSCGQSCVTPPAIDPSTKTEPRIQVAEPIEFQPSPATTTGAPLPPPAPKPQEDFDAPESFCMAVATNSSDAQAHVLRGIHQLICFWDEAARMNFQQALAIDPDCTMAHWGIIMSTIDPNSDFRELKIDSLEAIKKIDDLKQLPPLEQAYLTALYAQLKVGNDAAAQVLQEQAQIHRKDKLNSLLRSLLGRKGHLAKGAPRAEQILSLQTLDDFLSQEPDNHAANFLRALIEESCITVSPATLFSAKKAAELAPLHPPSQLLFGTYLFRTGDYLGAIASFQKAAQCYKAWQEQKKLSLADNPGYIKALLALCTSQWCVGDKKSAQQSIKELFALPIDHTRPLSPTTLLQYWEVRSLPLRFLLSGERPLKKSDVQHALEQMRSYLLDKNAGLANIQLLILSNFAYSQMALDSKDFHQTKKTIEKANKLSVELNEKITLADKAGALSYWLRTREISDLSILEATARQNLIMPELWYEKASDNTLAPSLLLPPILPYPSELSLARYYFLKKDYAHTLQAVEEGLLRYPRLPALLYLQKKAQKKGIEKTPSKK